ncbi:MAG: histidine kinase [Tannerella sp.]|nr:histidine kinase [Tannerella sp.]
MNLLDKYSLFKLLMVSMISAAFVVYPNISCLAFDLSFLDVTARKSHIWFFCYRYAFFTALFWILLAINLRRLSDAKMTRRFLVSLLVTLAAYAIYVGLSVTCYHKSDCFGSVLLFQFFVACILSAIAGHVSLLYIVQRKKEQEIEQLKIENLQSHCDALANQINPHFFFNSLNGLTALIRKKDEDKTLEYVNKLSDVFRYILQSDKKGLVELEEELRFVQAFRYMMEVRFANKLTFSINVDEHQRNLHIPVLSILPLIDNVVTHNTIDSQHKMDVSITLNEANELVVSNPVFPKLTPSVTNGTGIKNLEHRFLLLMNKQIRINCNEKFCTVYLPLK